MIGANEAAIGSEQCVRPSSTRDGRAAEIPRSATKDLDAYDMLLGDALAGDTFRFARQDHVEEAWRIVAPALDPAAPLHVYEPGSWGPSEAEGLVPGGWFVAKE